MASKKNNEKSNQKKGLARLIEIAGPKKHNLIFACVLSVVSSAARLIPFFTIYGVICELLKNYNNISAVNTKNLYTLIIITFISALIYGICSFTSSILSHSAAYDILYQLRITILNKLGKIPSGYFTGTTQGAIKKIISDDVEQIEVFIAHHIADTAAATALPLFTLIYLFIMDWRLGLVTLFPVLISLFILGIGLKNPKGAQSQVDMHNNKEKMEGTIVEYIHGMPVIKVFNRTLSAFKQYETNVSAYVDSVENAANFFKNLMGAFYTFFGAQLLFILPASILLISKATSYIDFLPIVLLFFLVGSGLKEPMENMMEMAAYNKRIYEGVSRIDNILYQDEISYKSDYIKPKNYNIDFDNVSFSYNNDEMLALENINFSLKEGTVTALVGPSGGGKSTVAQLLLRFYDVQKGCIKIGGVNIKDIPPSELSNMISFVFQDSVLFQDTIENNIRMGNKEATKEDVITAAKNANIHERIMQLPHGYNTIIGEKDSYLSGGEKQRIAIARVFLKNSPIVILDEATAYADAENESKIQQAFAELAKEKTVLVIAHRIKSIEKSDKILVLKNGNVVGNATHSKLINECSLYKNMVDANERRSQWTIKKGAVRA